MHTACDPDDAVHPDVGEVLFTPDAIAARTAALGAQIAVDYEKKKPLVVCTLKGSVLFFADLVRRIQPVPDGLRLEFIRAKSYHGSDTETSGSVDLRMSTFEEKEVRGRHVLLVEDIIDTGLTGDTLVRHFTKLGAASVEMCAMLNKPSRREVEGFEAKYIGFEVEDKFVVGMGLDFNEAYRSLPSIGVLRSEKYS